MQKEACSKIYIDPFVFGAHADFLARTLQAAMPAARFAVGRYVPPQAAPSKDLEGVHAFLCWMREGVVLPDVLRGDLSAPIPAEARALRPYAAAPSFPPFPLPMREDGASDDAPSSGLVPMLPVPPVGLRP